MNQFIITLFIAVWMILGAKVIMKEIDKGFIKDEMFAFLLCFVWPLISLCNFIVFLYRKIKLLL